MDFRFCFVLHAIHCSLTCKSYLSSSDVLSYIHLAMHFIKAVYTCVCSIGQSILLFGFAYALHKERFGGLAVSLPHTDEGHRIMQKLCCKH